jgi:hypothetical protein
LNFEALFARIFSVTLKFCNLCQNEKEISEFAWKLKLKKTRQSYCKSCQKIRSQEHYRNNKQKYIEQARKRNQKVLESIQNYVWDYLSEHPCVDCGEKDVVVLEFDHKSSKLYNLSEIIKERSSLTKVKKEIEKCVVRCANCHRRKTAKDFEWKKTILPR